MQQFRKGNIVNGINYIIIYNNTTYKLCIVNKIYTAHVIWLNFKTSIKCWWISLLSSPVCLTMCLYCKKKSDVDHCRDSWLQNSWTEEFPSIAITYQIQATILFNSLFSSLFPVQLQSIFHFFCYDKPNWSE